MLRAYLELLRPPNVATALGDVLAGFAVAGLANLPALPWLLISTACLYAGGIVLNDIFDRQIDASERPERPLPSGRVQVSQATGLAVLLLGLGVAAAAFATNEGARIAVAIVFAVVAYDGWSKKTWLGPMNMGACRALNLALGMAAVPGTLSFYWPLCLIPLTYISGVTVLSRGEVSGGRRPAGTLALALVVTAIAAASYVAIRTGRHIWPALVLTAILAWRVVPAYVSALQNPTAAAIRTAVKQGVLSLVLLDAALATAFVGVGYGLLLLGTAVGAIWLGRTFAVT